MRDAVSVTVPRPIYNRIKARLKPYQAMAGALEELLDLADKYSPLPKAPEPTQTPPKPQEDSKPLEQTKSEGNNANTNNKSAS